MTGLFGAVSAPIVDTKGDLSETIAIALREGALERFLSSETGSPEHGRDFAGCPPARLNGVAFPNVGRHGERPTKTAKPSAGD